MLAERYPSRQFTSSATEQISGLYGRRIAGELRCYSGAELPVAYSPITLEHHIQQFEGSKRIFRQ